MASNKRIKIQTAVKAITALHEGDGATAKKITKYLQMTHKNGTHITEKDVALLLKKAIDKGEVVAKGGKYHQVRRMQNAVDGRRRRRSRSRGRRRRSRSRRRRGGRRSGRRSRSRRGRSRRGRRTSSRRRRSRSR